MTRLFGVIAVLLVFSTLSAASAPEPAAVERPGEWTLRTQFEHLQPIIMPTEQGQDAQRFWYLIMTVTNKTDRDVDFDTSCILMTDNFQLIPSGKDVPPAVYERLKKRYERRYPLLQTMSEAGRRILQGEDNAKDIVVVWPDFDKKAKGLNVFIKGLSSETAVVEHPTEKDDDGEPVKMYLRKTLKLDYDIIGDPAVSPRVKLDYEGQNWVMR